MIQFQIEQFHAIKTISCNKCNFKNPVLITTFGIIGGKIIWIKKNDHYRIKLDFQTKLPLWYKMLNLIL